MLAATLDDLRASTPAIKVEWSRLLRGEEALTPLGRPETLVFLMEATLTQLFAGFEIDSKEKWLRLCPPVIASVHQYCACGFSPLLQYFKTGELALRTVSEPRLGAGIAEVLERFHVLAQQEVQALCSDCRHKGIPGFCVQLPKPPGGV